MSARDMRDGAMMTDEKIGELIDQWYFHSDIHVKAKILLFARELLSASKPAVAQSFEAWAQQEGLISESHGVRFVNSMCDVASKAWYGALAASPTTPAQCGCQISFAQLNAAGDLERVTIHYGDSRVAYVVLPAQSVDDLTRELLDTLQATVKHFTKAPSTLADSTVRGTAHEVIAKAHAQIGYTAPAVCSPSAVVLDDERAAFVKAVGFERPIAEDSGNSATWDEHRETWNAALAFAARVTSPQATATLPAQTFEQWASEPQRADKIPLAKHPNGAYSDTRSYLIYYGWKSALKHGVERSALTVAQRDSIWVAAEALEKVDQHTHADELRALLTDAQSANGGES